MQILDTYTHIIRAIISCKTNDQLTSCQPLISGMDKFNDRPDFADWVKKIDETYIKQREELKKPKITSHVVTSMSFIPTDDNTNEPDSAHELINPKGAY